MSDYIFAPYFECPIQETARELTPAEIDALLCDDDLDTNFAVLIGGRA